MSYQLRVLGDEAPAAPESDVRRGYVRVPSFDVRQYVKDTVLMIAIGFGLGIGVGAIFGNILRGKQLPSVGRLVQNRRRRLRRNAGRRRTSARQRRRGRPSGHPVNERLTVKLPGGAVDVSVEGGKVYVGRNSLGSVYDLGTSFRAVPIAPGEVRSFGTLAGAVKHVLRATEAA